MWAQTKNHNFWIVLAIDIVLTILAYYCAYLIRFEGRITEFFVERFSQTVWWLTGVKIACLFMFGVYKGMWRYTSIQDLKKLITASVFSSAIIVCILALSVRFQGFSRSVFTIDFLLFFIFVCGFRVAIRLYYQKQDGQFFHSFPGFKADNYTKMLIIGAGDAGEKTLREIRDNKRLFYRVVGFIDDALGKTGRTIHGVPVIGTLSSLHQHVQDNEIEEIIIAVPSATGEQMRLFVDACKTTGVKYKTLPGIGEIIDGRVSLKALRDVSFKDLLGRPAVKLDSKGISSYLESKRVLVTGAGGSIGSELCRQIIRFNPSKLILMDNSEPGLYAIGTDLNQACQYDKTVSLLGDVQNELLLGMIFKQYKPDVVFHAAAYKHVPLVEQNPWQGMLNNVLGTQCVLKACTKYQTGQLVLVSTDKAVRPTNVMGASKRICELLVNAYRESATTMMAVRFGNVVGSSGSVVPLFRDQIARGGPVTVTHPEVTRYFMTIPEASQLILQAGALGGGGEIFILEMGTPVKIANMARDLIRLSGKDPDRDIEIQFTGLRPGEKLYEELITEGEGIVPTGHEKIMVLKANNDWNGHGSWENYRQWVLDGVEELYRLARAHDGVGIRCKLHELIPEYDPQDSECVL
ncbi:MAG: polysaccharide biosynthesis protein [Desulfobacterales bacterium]|nr:polysaccharide biosynthesis protein [Desulfobacterales bacterium]